MFRFSGKKLNWGNTCRKKLYYIIGVSHLKSSISTRVKLSLFTKTKVISTFSPSLAELPVLTTVYPKA